MIAELLAHPRAAGGLLEGIQAGLIVHLDEDWVAGQQVSVDQLVITVDTGDRGIEQQPPCFILDGVIDITLLLCAAELKAGVFVAHHQADLLAALDDLTLAQVIERAAGGG